MAVVDAIGALPIWNAGGVFSELPLIDFPGNPPIEASHLVLMDIEVLSDFIINAGLNDAWVNAAAEFQGMFITVFPELKIIFVAWFTFDSELPAGDAMAVFGAPDQRWVTAVGSYDGNRAELKAELTSGGRFNSPDPLPVQDTEYGSIILEFSDCRHAIVSFDFPGASESGQFDIQRVLESNVAKCEELNMQESPQDYRMSR